VNAIRSTKVWGTMCFVGEGATSISTSARICCRRQLTLLASWTFSNIIQADCARFSVERASAWIDGSPRWRIDQGRDEAYKLFDRQVDGKGRVLM